MDNYFRYSYEKCPVCEKEFANDDDIVVCPLCGTPHHRDCYKKNGECSNYDKHSEGFHWTPSKENKLVTEDTAPLPPVDAAIENEQPITNAFYGVNPLSQFPKKLKTILQQKMLQDLYRFTQLSIFVTFSMQNPIKRLSVGQRFSSLLTGFSIEKCISLVQFLWHFLFY